MPLFWMTEGIDVMYRLFPTIVLLIFVIGLTLSAQDDSPIIRTQGDVAYTVQRVSNANYPVALAFAPDGRLFYTEKNTGNVRVITVDGERLPDPVITLDTSGVAERGMFGIAFDPDYAENGHIWVAHISAPTARDLPENRIIRFTETDNVGTDAEVMFATPLTNNALIHHGGNLHFDEDGYLYYSIGDNEIAAHSQDLTTPQGAIHRFEVTDGGLTTPADNPITDSTIYAYGLRNSFDFAFDPGSRRIYATENGQHCDDEINLILPGFQYGAGANYECGATSPDSDPMTYLPPLLTWEPTIAPTGILVYDHEAIPDWQGDIFFCTWNEAQIVRAILDESRTQIIETQALDIGDATCRIDIALGPEGGLYFTTVGGDEGVIYRLLPE